MRYIAISLLVLPGSAVQAMQTAPPPPAEALVMTAAEVGAMVQAYPGGNTSIKSIDAGEHVVDFWLEQRPAGLTAEHGDRGQAHAELTEIYYVVQGEATMVIGGELVDPEVQTRLPEIEWPGGARFLSPTYAGAFTGGSARTVVPGDVVVLPPGAVHQWISVGSEDLVYFIARIDPAHRQAAGYVNPALR